DFLFGVRLSAKDFNYLPVLNLRWPLVWPLRHYWMGNSLHETLEYGRRLKELGVDYLHIDSGFGFINPKGNPGKYPLDGLRIFANSTRHLSTKAKVRPSCCARSRRRCRARFSALAGTTWMRPTPG